ncbi:MAG: hypothetical protein WCF04_06990 [Candidatus Nanopelagicales bacterium]
MTVLVLIGPAATEPVEIARRVAEGRELTAFVDVATVVRSLDRVRGIDAESRHFLGVDMATGMAARAAADALDVVIAEAGPYRSAAAYRDGLLLLDKVTLVALTADASLLAMRDFSRGPDMLTSLGAWRQWRANLTDMMRSKPSFTDFDVILDCANWSRADLVRLISAAL